MRKYFIFFCLLCSMAVHAQESEIVKNRLSEIRKMYDEAKQLVADNDKVLPYSANDTEIVSHYMIPGCGPSTDVTHYYFTFHFDEHLSTTVYTPYFITRKFNVAAQEFYQELLYDGNGSLVFFYQKNFDDEVRYYWGANGFFHDITKGENNIDMVSATKLSNYLTNAFDYLLNRE